MALKNDEKFEEEYRSEIDMRNLTNFDSSNRKSRKSVL